MILTTVFEANAQNVKSMSGFQSLPGGPQQNGE